MTIKKKTTKKEPQPIVSDIQYKQYSILIEDMWVGKELLRTLSVKVLNKEGKYDMYQSSIPKGSVLDKEVNGILKEIADGKVDQPGQ